MQFSCKGKIIINKFIFDPNQSEHLPCHAYVQSVSPSLLTSWKDVSCLKNSIYNESSLLDDKMCGTSLIRIRYVCLSFFVVVQTKEGIFFGVHVVVNMMEAAAL